MNSHDDITDSGPKMPVRTAIRPHLDFILAKKAEGKSEASIHRYLLGQGHKVGSRTGFAAALKALTAERAGKAAAHTDATVPTDQEVDSAAVRHDRTRYGEHRHLPEFGNA